MGLGAMELVLILAVVLVVFGAGKLSGVGKAVGKSVREFKDEVHTDDSPENKSDDDDRDTHESG